MESVFSIVIGDRLEQLELLKRTLPKMFFWESSDIFKRGVFPNILRKMHEVIFYKC